MDVKAARYELRGCCWSAPIRRAPGGWSRQLSHTAEHLRRTVPRIPG